MHSHCSCPCTRNRSRRLAMATASMIGSALTHYCPKSRTSSSSERALLLAHQFQGSCKDAASVSQSEVKSKHIACTSSARRAPPVRDQGTASRRPNPLAFSSRARSPGPAGSFGFSWPRATGRPGIRPRLRPIRLFWPISVAFADVLLWRIVLRRDWPRNSRQFCWPHCH